jgi:hypothetical protein
MRKLLLLIVCSSLCNTPILGRSSPRPLQTPNGSASLSQAQDAQWMRAFVGKDSSELTNDPRFTAFNLSVFGLTPLPFTTERFPDAIESYLGPPEPVKLVEDRYIVLSSCAPDFCVEKVFLWIDSKDSSRSIAAIVTVGAKLTSGARDAQGDNSNVHLWLVSRLTEAELINDAPYLTTLHAWLMTEVDPALAGRSNEGRQVNAFTLIKSPSGGTTELASSLFNPASIPK